MADQEKFKQLGAKMKDLDAEGFISQHVDELHKKVKKEIESRVALNAGVQESLNLASW